MKRFSAFGLLVFLSLVFVMGSGFTPAGEKAEVKIDGQLIQPKGTLKFERDDTVYLEATGIEPNSIIKIKIKKAGIRWANHDFRVNDSGEVTGIMHMPEKKLKVSCTVYYNDADGTSNEVQFKFQTI